jgi:hypothetical protein
MRILKAVAMSTALCVSACSAWCGWAMWTANHELVAHLRIIRTVNAALGFTYETPYENGTEVFVITEVSPDGPMDRAGLKVGDYPKCSIASLYERIVFGQGRAVEVPVTRQGKPMVLRVAVPTMALSDDPAKLHWYFTKHHD